MAQERARDAAGRFVGTGGPSFTLKGQDAMNKRLKRIAAQFGNKIESALRIEAELVMTKSKRDHVPVDLGTLRNSGHVGRPVRVGKDVSVTMAYGGPAAAYALAVHEHPSRHSPPSWENIRDEQGRFRRVQFSPSGRGPKYLERPLMDAIPGMPERIAARLNIERI